MEVRHKSTALILPSWEPRTTEGRFICDDCEYGGLTFDETHTVLHRITRVSEKVKVEERSTEERLQFLEDELAKVKQMLGRLVEKSTEGPRDGPLTNGDPTRPTPNAQGGVWRFGKGIMRRKGHAEGSNNYAWWTRPSNSDID